MNSDRDLLETAAAAAGFTVYEHGWRRCGGECLKIGHRKTFMEDPEQREWNPLTDDGDALRLAVKMRMLIATDFGMTTLVISSGESKYACTEAHGDDAFAATRRAIVRAAASINQPSTPNEPAKATAKGGSPGSPS